MLDELKVKPGTQARIADRDPATTLGVDKKDGEKRVDGEVLTTYTGTLPGSLVDPIIPSADKAGTYQTAVGIDEHGRIATLRVTGSFFAHDGDVTYDLAFDDYDKSVTISAP